MDVLEKLTPQVDQIEVLDFESESTKVEFEANNWNCEIVGTVPEYEQARNFKVVKGRYFNYEELENSERVAVIGTEARENLFGTADPIGQIIKLNQHNFRVVGLLEEKGQVGWRNQDDMILIPISTAQKRAGDPLRRFLDHYPRRQ